MLWHESFRVKDIHPKCKDIKCENARQAETMEEQIMQLTKDHEQLQKENDQMKNEINSMHRENAKSSKEAKDKGKESSSELFFETLKLRNQNKILIRNNEDLIEENMRYQTEIIRINGELQKEREEYLRYRRSIEQDYNKQKALQEKAKLEKEISYLKMLKGKIVFECEKAKKLYEETLQKINEKRIEEAKRKKGVFSILNRGQPQRIPIKNRKK